MNMFSKSSSKSSNAAGNEVAALKEEVRQLRMEVGSMDDRAFKCENMVKDCNHRTKQMEDSFKDLRRQASELSQCVSQLRFLVEGKRETTQDMGKPDSFSLSNTANKVDGAVDQLVLLAIEAQVDPLIARIKEQVIELVDSKIESIEAVQKKNLLQLNKAMEHQRSSLEGSMRADQYRQSMNRSSDRVANDVSESISGKMSDRRFNETVSGMMSDRRSPQSSPQKQEENISNLSARMLNSAQQSSARPETTADKEILGIGSAFIGRSLRPAAGRV